MTKILIHNPLTSHVADISEFEDMLSVKRGTRASFSSHISLVSKGNFYLEESRETKKHESDS